MERLALRAARPWRVGALALAVCPWGRRDAGRVSVVVGAGAVRDIVRVGVGLFALFLLFAPATCAARAQAPFDPYGVVVVDGNSLVVHRGNLAHWPACLTATTEEPCVHPLADWLWATLGQPARLSVYEAGLRGAGTQELIARAPEFVDAKFVAWKPVRVVLFWEGSNDLYFGRGPTVALENLNTYVAARHAIGWRVAVLTVIPRSEPTLPATWEWQRLQLNAQIRAGATGADVALDLAADALFLDTAVTSGPLYQDGVHLSERGVRTVAAWIAGRPEWVTLLSK